MSELLLSPVFLTAFLTALIAATLPLMLAAVGETIGEQAGILNLGIEGVMLIGAYFAFVATLGTGSFWIGAAAGVLSGVITSLLMLVLNVLLGLNQIVIGLAVTMIGGGITSVLYLQNYAKTSPGLGSAPKWDIPLLGDIPVIGPAVFQQPGVFWFCVALTVAVSWLLTQTNWGLGIRAAGQKPASLDTAGGSVVRTRSTAVLLGGVFSGLAGACLAMLSTSTFTPFMVNGLGYVAIVITMLSRGRIGWVAVTSLLYGVTVAFGTALQLTNVSIPADVIKMLPFVVVMITLIVFSRRAVVPPALAVPYIRGAR